MDPTALEPDVPEPSRTGVTRQSVVTSAVWNSIATLAGIPILAITTIGLARILGATGYGRLALYTLLIALCTGFTELGLGSSILRIGAVAVGRNDEKAAIDAVRAGTTWSMAQLPWAVLFGFLVLPTPTSAALYTIAAVLSLSFLGPSHYLVMTNRLRIPSLQRLATLVLSAVATLTTAKATHRPDLTFAVSSIAGSALTFAQVFAVPRALRRAVLRPGRIHLTRRDIAFGIGNMVNGQLNNLVFTKSEILFFRARQARARGQFAAAHTLAARSTLVADALLGNLNIGLANALGRGEEHLRRAFRQASDAVVIFLMAVAPATLAGLAVLSEPLLGSSYGHLAGPIAVLGAMALLQTGAIPLLGLRFAERSVVPLIVAGLVSTVVDLGLAALLVPHRGVVGGVIANVAGSVVYLIVTAALFRASHAARTAVISHAVRVAVLVTFAGTLPIVLIALPTTAAYAAAVPLTIVWTLVGFRLPLLRVNHATLVGLTEGVVPARIARLVAQRWAQLLIGGVSPHATQS